MTHCRLCHGFRSFFQGAAYGLIGEGIDDVHLDHPISKQTQCPASLTVWWRTARDRHQMGLGTSIELAWPWALWRTRVECRVESFLDEALADTFDGRTTGLHRSGNSLIRQSTIRMQQDAGMTQASRRSLPDSNQFPEFRAFVVGQRDNVFLMHDRSVPRPVHPIKSSVTRYYPGWEFRVF